jgi:hypothetical protein
MSKLDQLLAKIERLPNGLKALCQRALSDFRPSRKVERPEDLERVLAEFHCKAQNLYLMQTRDIEHSHDYSMAVNVLIREIGPSAFRKTFQMIITHENTGLHQMLTALSNGLAKEWAKEGVKVLVGQYLNTLNSYEEKMAASKEYFSKYSHLLPAQFQGIEVFANLHHILETHPYVISETMNVRG